MSLATWGFACNIPTVDGFGWHCPYELLHACWSPHRSDGSGIQCLKKVLEDHWLSTGMELKSRLLHLDKALRILINLNVWMVYIIQEFPEPPHRASCWQTLSEKLGPSPWSHGAPLVCTAAVPRRDEVNTYLCSSQIFGNWMFCVLRKTLCAVPQASVSISASM